MLRCREVSRDSRLDYQSRIRANVDRPHSEYTFILIRSEWSQRISVLSKRVPLLLYLFLNFLKNDDTWILIEKNIWQVTWGSSFQLLKLGQRVCLASILFHRFILFILRSLVFSYTCQLIGKQKKQGKGKRKHCLIKSLRLRRFFLPLEDRNGGSVDSNANFLRGLHYLKNLPITPKKIFYTNSSVYSTLIEFTIINLNLLNSKE